MNAASPFFGASRGLLCLLLALAIVFGVPGLMSTAAAADVPAVAADAGSPLFASWLQDVVGNRTRLIQASFIFIIIGICILWKK